MSFFTSFRCGKSNLNNHSIVTVFEYLGVKMLIPGDNESESWLELLQDAAFYNASQNCEVMLAPHHGRKAGFCGELLDHVKPRVVVISDGPEGETSCTENYAAKIRQWHSKGVKAAYRDDSWDERYCLTTRQDGLIRVQIYSWDNQNWFRVVLFNGRGKNR